MSCKSEECPARVRNVLQEFGFFSSRGSFFLCGKLAESLFVFAYNISVRVARVCWLMLQTFPQFPH